MLTSGDHITVLTKGSAEKPPMEQSELQKHKQVKQKVIQFETQITFLDLKSSDVLNTPFPLEIWLLTLLGNLSTRCLFTAGRWRMRPTVAVECQK